MDGRRKRSSTIQSHCTENAMNVVQSLMNKLESKVNTQRSVVGCVCGKRCMFFVFHPPQLWKALNTFVGIARGSKAMPC